MLLGDHALRPDRPTSSAGGASGRAQACGPPGEALFRLTPPLRRAVAHARDVTGGGASAAAGCRRRHWSRLGLGPVAQELGLGRRCCRVCVWSLAPLRDGVRGDIEAAYGVRGGAAEPRFPEAATLCPSVRPHSGPPAPGRRATAASDADAADESPTACPARQRASPSNSG